MEVPFKVMMDFIAEYRQQKHLEFNTQEKYAAILGMSKSYYSRFLSGKHVSNGKQTYPIPEGAVFYGAFHGFIKLYEIDKDNYRSKAKAFIHDLERNRKVSPIFIDTAQYVQDINNEIIPPDGKTFSRFLSGCVFYHFLLNYIKLWDDPAYRDHQPSQIKNEGNVPPYHYYDLDIHAYMAQSLRDGSGADVLTVDPNKQSCDFSFFQENRVSLVQGPGGQGKTLFLYALRLTHGMTDNDFDDVLIVPLVDLTLFRKEADNSCEDWIYEYIRLHYPQAALNDTQKRYLLLLDGFNEYLASKNTQAVDKITADINRLLRQTAQTAEPRISVVITTRDVQKAMQMLTKSVEKRTFTLSGTSKAVYESIKARCESSGIPFEDREISRLARTPLYALLLVGLKDPDFSSIKSQYTLLDMVYRSRADQRLGGELHKSSYDKAVYLYLYYVYLPYIAYHTVMSDDGDNTYTFSKGDVRRLFLRLKNDHLDETLLETAVEEQELSITQHVPDIDIFQLRYFLDNEKSDIIRIENSDAVFRFSHEIWRDYLVAKFMHINLHALKENYASPHPGDFIGLTLSYNVSSNTAQLFLQSFNWFSAPETNARRMEDYFRIDPKSIGRRLFGVICLLHTAFDINEYLKIDLPRGNNKENKCLQNILSPLSSYIGTNTRCKDKIKSDEKIALFTCEILSKVTEYYRLTDKYHPLYSIIESAKKIDPDSDIMLNQEAKMYLSCSERKATAKQCRANRPADIVFPEPLNKMDVSALYNKGVKLLALAVSRGFHLSGNTAGLLKSTAAPVLLMDRPQIKPDFCGAFMCYMQVIYGAGYVRRDIAYTVRQALNMLLKGFVRVCGDSAFDPENEYTDLGALRLEVCSPLFSRTVNEKTLSLAKQLVKKAEGQELAGLNYLRGTALLLEGRKEDAQLYFKARYADESTLMSDIRLKYEYGEKELDSRIRSQFCSLISDIRETGFGTYERTHPAYRYIDAKQLALSYAQGEQYRQAEMFFSELESDEKVHEIVTMIMDYMNRK